MFQDGVELHYYQTIDDIFDGNMLERRDIMPHSTSDKQQLMIFELFS